MSLPKTKKAQISEEKGDQLAKKGRAKKALEHYLAALELNKASPSLYDKVIKAHDELKAEWTNEDFAKSLDWTMKKQELANPALKRLHAKLTPEWQEISQHIQRVMSAKTGEDETAGIEKIHAYGDRAIYPLIEILLAIKKFKTKP